MKEKIYEVMVYIAPLVAGFITSIIIPLIIKRSSVKYLKKRIDEVNEGKEFKEIKSELKEIKKEIFEMRGKRK